MHQVAEFSIAERIVAQILDYGASVGIGMSLFDLIFRQSWKSFQQKRTNRIGPQKIHDLLMSQYRISARSAAAHEHDENKHRQADRKQAPTGNHDYHAHTSLRLLRMLGSQH